MLQLINKGFQDCGRQVIGLWFYDEQLTLMTVCTPLGMSWCQKFLKVFEFLEISLHSEAEEVQDHSAQIKGAGQHEVSRGSSFG